MKTIRELREEQGWSQFTLAVKVDVTPNTIRSWEQGKTEPKASQLRALSEVFGVPMDQITWAPREEVEEGKVAA